MHTNMTTLGKEMNFIIQQNMTVIWIRCKMTLKQPYMVSEFHILINMYYKSSSSSTTTTTTTTYNTFIDNLFSCYLYHDYYCYL